MKREGVEEEEVENKEILNFFRLLMKEYTAFRVKNQELLKVINESELVHLLQDNIAKNERIIEVFILTSSSNTSQNENLIYKEELNILTEAYTICKKM